MAHSFLAMLLTLLAAMPTQAHTWVEDAHVVAGNGTMIGTAGYPRGNVLRTNKAFGDAQMTYLIPPDGRSTGNAILSTDLMCKASQTMGNQTAGSPALSASPGDMIALRYQENGHVTLPQNQPGKPANRGTVFIYGTSNASDSDTLLSIHKVWNAEGTGGDGRGALLATQNFDDGQCYQANGGNISLQRQEEFTHVATNPMGVNLWCQVDFTIPTTVQTSGQYSIYWVWDWPTAVGTVGQEAGLNETYTSCLDLNMVSGTGTSKSLDFKTGQDLNSAAIQSELSTAYIVTTGTSTNEPAATAGTAASSSNSQITATSARTTSAHASAVASASGDTAETVTVTVEATPVMQYSTVTATVTPGQMTTTSSMPAVATLESGSMVAIPASVQSSTPSSSPATSSSASSAMHSVAASEGSSAVPSAAVGSAPIVQPFIVASQQASTTKSLNAPGTTLQTVASKANAVVTRSIPDMVTAVQTINVGGDTILETATMTSSEDVTETVAASVTLRGRVVPLR